MRIIAATAAAAVAAATFAIGVGVEPAGAVVSYTVTTTDDTDDDGECATDCTLREAVNLADGDGDDSEIVLPNGTYVLDECDVSEGDLDHVADEDLSIDGNNATINQTCADQRFLEHDGDSSLVTLTDLFVTGGSPNAGGGAIMMVDGDLTLMGTSLVENEATGGGSGGAIDALSGDSTLTIVDSMLRGNISSDTGGAIRNTPGTTVIERSTIAGNSAAGGGAIDGDDVTIHNSTITGNTASGGVGGVRGGSVLDIKGSTIVDNTATGGAANVNNGGTLTVAGSIIANGHGGPDCAGSQLRTSNGYNVGGDNSCDLDEPTDVEQVGNALLGPLTIVSGSTPTRVPLADSPAHDLVPNAVCVAAGPPVFANDQRGILRPRPTATDDCDAGAVEGSDDDFIADALVKRPGKPFVGAGIFSTEGTGQKASLKRKPGRTAVYTVQSRNGSPVTVDDITVGASPSIGPFKTKYIVDGVNVTDAVNAGSHETTDLPPGIGERMTVKVKVKNSAAPGDKLVLQVAATPTNLTFPDAVRMVTKAN